MQLHLTLLGLEIAVWEGVVYRLTISECHNSQHASSQLADWSPIPHATIPLHFSPERRIDHALAPFLLNIRALP
jgi:hypothetical protein